MSIDRTWPPAARRWQYRLAVTLYGLPHLDVYSEIYLKDPGMEMGRTGMRLEALLRRADAILAISEATAADAVERLRIPERRVTAWEQASL